MKITSKILALLLAAALLTPLAGCAGSGGEAAQSDTAPTADTQSAVGGNSDFDFSSGIGDDGYLTGIRALDYVKLPEYKGIEIPADDHTASDDEMNEQISSLLSSYEQTAEITDRAVEEGDSVNIDYVGTVDGVEFEDGSTNGQGADVTAGGGTEEEKSEAGDEAYIYDFLAQIVGHMPGETFDAEVTFPETFEKNPDLAGKKAVFNTTVNYISEKTTPELTDEFVQEKLTAEYSWQTADEVRDYLRSIIEERKTQTFIDNYLIDNSEITEIPESLIEYQQNAYKSYYSNMAAQYNITFEDYIKSSGYESEKEYYEAQRPTYEKAAKVMLLMQAVAESEEIDVGEDDVDEFIKTEYASMSEDMIPQIKAFYGSGFWYREMIVESVYDLIRANADMK